MNEYLTVIEPELTWTGSAFARHMQVHLDQRGHIASLTRLQDSSPHDGAALHLPRRALLPGFINVHSHAFQRGLRGLGESFPKGAGNFWTWREAMYGLVNSLTPDTAYELSKQAFTEMLLAGITTVGEFHYIHHDATHAGYGLDEAIIAAARDAGIRLVLLQTYYRTGAVQQPLRGGQLRFRTNSPDEFWHQFDVLAGKLHESTQTIAAVVHSIRAASPEDIRAIRQESRKRNMVFHMHIEEQRKEIEECIAAYGKTPMQVIREAAEPDETFTAIHCTHTTDADMEVYLRAGASVGLCPLTEGNLGDGIANVPHMLQHKGHVCIGTDSNARLSFTEELRWLEYVQRVARELRGAVVDQQGEVATKLLTIGTANGARSLGLPTGTMQAGKLADFIVVDLDHPSLAGVADSNLLPAFILGSGNEAITAAIVGGHWRELRRGTTVS